MEKVFLDSDCDYFVSLWEAEIARDETFSKYIDFDTKRINYSKTKAQAKYIHFNSPSEVSYLLSLIECLDVKSIHSNSFAIIKYSTGDYFAPHRDARKYPDGNLNRTLIFQLSDSNDYTGGDLIVEGVKQTRERGSCIKVSSEQVHEVTKLESGTRYALVVFLLDSDIKYETRII